MAGWPEIWPDEYLPRNSRRGKSKGKDDGKGKGDDEGKGKGEDDSKGASKGKGYGNQSTAAARSTLRALPPPPSTPPTPVPRDTSPPPEALPPLALRAAVYRESEERAALLRESPTQLAHFALRARECQGDLGRICRLYTEAVLAHGQSVVFADRSPTLPFKGKGKDKGMCYRYDGIDLRSMCWSPQPRQELGAQRLSHPYDQRWLRMVTRAVIMLWHRFVGMSSAPLQGALVGAAVPEAAQIWGRLSSSLLRLCRRQFIPVMFQVEDFGCASSSTDLVRSSTRITHEALLQRLGVNSASASSSSDVVMRSSSSSDFLEEC